MGCREKSMPRSLIFLLSGLLSLIFADAAQAEKRVALVVGISSYRQVPRLNNPVHDAEAIAALIARLLQAHLKRVGCNSGKIDGDWDESSQRSLELFNNNAKTNFDTKVASLEALDAVRNATIVCAR
jgi:hypothetical protein